jgi:hypothetical protein
MRLDRIATSANWPVRLLLLTGLISILGGALSPQTAWAQEGIEGSTARTLPKAHAHPEPRYEPKRGPADPHVRQDETDGPSVRLDPHSGSQVEKFDPEDPGSGHLLRLRDTGQYTISLDQLYEPDPPVGPSSESRVTTLKPKNLGPGHLLRLRDTEQYATSQHRHRDETLFFDNLTRNNSFDELHGFDGTVVVSDPKNVWPVRQLLGPQALVLLQLSDDPQTGLSDLTMQPKHLKLAYSIPKSLSEATSVHGSQAVNQLTMANLESVRSQIVFLAAKNAQVGLVDLTAGATNGVVEVATSKSTADRLRELAKSTSKDDLLVVLCHNIKGELIFPDESRCHINDLRGAGKIWTLSCDTLAEIDHQAGVGWGTGRTITYGEAVTAIAVLLEGVSGGKTYGDLLRALQSGRFARANTFPASFHDGVYDQLASLFNGVGVFATLQRQLLRSAIKSKYEEYKNIPTEERRKQQRTVTSFGIGLVQNGNIIIGGTC